MLQKKVDEMRNDQYTVVGKLYQLSYVLANLKKTAVEAVDLFSAYNEDDHVPFMAAVQDSLDSIDIMAEALTDTHTLLEWMRAKRSEIFNASDNE